MPAGLGVDSRLEVALPRSGDYYVELHDSRFSEQEENFYRLKIGAFTYAEGIFPLGWKRGGEVEVEFSGGNLAKPVTARPDLALPGGDREFHEHLGAGQAGQLAVSFPGQQQRRDS